MLISPTPRGVWGNRQTNCAVCVEFIYVQPRALWQYSRKRHLLQILGVKSGGESHDLYFRARVNHSAHATHTTPTTTTSRSQFGLHFINRYLGWLLPCARLYMFTCATSCSSRIMIKIGSLWFDDINLKNSGNRSGKWNGLFKKIFSTTEGTQIYFVGTIYSWIN